MLNSNLSYTTKFLKIGGRNMEVTIDTIRNLTALTLLIGLFSAIFWMVVGWRAMRAHEKLADSMEWLAREYYRKEQDSNASKIE